MNSVCIDFDFQRSSLRCADHAYFINYYGENCARLNFDQTVHGWRYQPSPLMIIVAPLLFMAPMSEVRLLHRIFVDDIASKERWNTFLTRLNSQFQAISVLVYRCNSQVPNKITD